MKLYTRGGDDGKTHLSGGPRVSKDNPHIEACGAVDELNAFLGLARTETLPGEIDQLLHRLQHELFGLGADLAMPGAVGVGDGYIRDDHVERLERDIDTFDSLVPPLKEFILPGGQRGAALLHVARTVCRRAERRVVTLVSIGPDQGIQSPLVRYLNRLADLLFVLPRVVNARANIDDEGWQKETR